MSHGWLPLLLVLLAGCGSTRAGRLQADPGHSLVVTVRPGAGGPLEVEPSDIQRALARLGREVRISAQPLEGARRWLGRPSITVYPLRADGSPGPRACTPKLVADYLAWCKRALGPGDCLRVLKDGCRLDEDGKYALAMASAYGSVLGETKRAFEEMVDPVAVTATIVGAGTVYMLLWVLPEPISKGIAGSVTVVLMGYLGVDTVWGIIGGWKDLVEAVDGAFTFEQIRAAGEAYGEVLGERAARVFIMVGTAAVGHTAAQFSSRLPRLPEFQQLALRAKDAMQVRLGALAEVESVALSAEGLVVSLAPGAMAMAMAESELSRWQGSPGAWQPPHGGPGEWVEDTTTMSERSRRYQAQVTKAPPGHAYRVRGNGVEVDFDGYEDDVLLEAKGRGFEQFIDDDLNPKDYYQGFKKMVEQAERQFIAANGTHIRWIVAERKLAGLLRKLFDQAGLADIEVIHLAPVP